MKLVYKILIKLMLKLHNLSYDLLNIFILKSEKIHPKHKLMKYHDFFVGNVSSEDNVLDIGCGKGEVSYDVAKKAKTVIGIDLNKESINKAQRNYKSPNLQYLVGDVTKELPDKKFDVIILSNVLEHIEDRQKFLKEIKKKTLKILVRVPMINRDWTVLYKKKLGVEWRLDPTHFTEYTLESFKEEIANAGLQIQEFSIQFGEIWAVVKNKK